MAEDRRRIDVLAAVRHRPFRDAGQGGARDILHLRAAGLLERGWGIGEGDVLAVVEGGRAIERQILVHPRAPVELDAADAHLLGVREITAKHADTRVDDLRLEVVDVSVEGREVRRHARERLGLQSDFDVTHVLGLHCRSAQNRLPRRVGGHAAKVKADRLEAGGIGREGVHTVGDVIGRRDLTRHIGVINVGLIRLRRKH